MAQADTLTQFNIDNGPNHLTTRWGQRKAEKCFRYWPILVHIVHKKGTKLPFKRDKP